jgi:hypothetical protein
MVSPEFVICVPGICPRNYPELQEGFVDSKPLVITRISEFSPETCNKMKKKMDVE